jgi:hypothetical protein
MGAGETQFPGYHAMVVSALTGHGDQDFLTILPATTTGAAGNCRGVGLSVFSTDALRSNSAPLLEVMHLRQILAGFHLLVPKPGETPPAADPLDRRSRQFMRFHRCAPR